MLYGRQVFVLPDICKIIIEIGNCLNFSTTPIFSPSFIILYVYLLLYFVTEVSFSLSGIGVKEVRQSWIWTERSGVFCVVLGEVSVPSLQKSSYMCLQLQSSWFLLFLFHHKRDMVLEDLQTVGDYLQTSREDLYQTLHKNYTKPTFREQETFLHRYRLDKSFLCLGHTYPSRYKKHTRGLSHS